MTIVGLIRLTNENGVGVSSVDSKVIAIFKLALKQAYCLLNVEMHVKCMSHDRYTRCKIYLE